MSLFESMLPPGLIYVPNWISIAEQEEIVFEIDKNEFDSTLSRRVQHYGARYDYERSRINSAGSAPPIPEVFRKIGQRLVHSGYFEQEPDQVIVNEYVRDQGIAAHADLKSFGPAIATISLLENWPMDFRSPEGEKISMILQAGSLAVMTGPSRYSWTHQIAKRKRDEVGGMRITRLRRLSLTLRTMPSVTA